MCQACTPGVILLTRSATEQLDFPNSSSDEAGVSTHLTNVTTTIFKNGTILTLAHGDFSPAAALVVRGDTIIYVGNENEAHHHAGPSATVIDLEGGSVLPGFIEPHIHLTGTAIVKNFYIDMSPLKVDSFEKAKQVLKDTVSKGPNMGKWIVAFGYDPSRVQPDHPKLTKQLLTEISADIPIVVINQSGHIAYANEQAFKEANITPENASADFVRDPVTGELTGEVFETGVSVLAGKAPPPSLSDIVKATHSTLLEWAGKGVTTAFDAGIGSTGQTDIPLLAAVTAEAPPLRLRGALVSTIVPLNTVQFIQPPPLNIGRVEVNAIKFWTDGSTQGFTAAVKEPYLPTELGNRGILNYKTNEILRASLEPWFKKGFSIVVHANGDAAIEQTLDVYEAVIKANPGIKHKGLHRIDHFTTASKEQIHRAAALGLSVSHTIGHVNYWGATFSDYVLGPTRASHIHPLATDISASLLFSLHSDTPVTDLHPLLYVRTAILRELYSPHSHHHAGPGPQSHPLHHHPNKRILGPEQRISLLEALKAITINPAQQLGLEKETGTLEVGKKADLVVLDQDIRDVDVRELDKLQVKETWLEGKVTFKR